MYKCSRTALGIRSSNCPDLVLPTCLTLIWSVLCCSSWCCRDVAQDRQRKRLDLTCYLFLKGEREWISDNREDLKWPHTYGACEPRAASGRAAGVCAASGKSRVGRCLSVRVPWHGTAGSHHEPPLHGRAKLGPTPAAAVQDASASDESKVN